DLGDGTNILNVSNGTVTGNVFVRGGAGTDTVNLGGTGTLAVNGNTRVNLDGGDSDVLDVKSGTTLHGVLQSFFTENVTLAAGSTVDKNVIILGGTGANTIHLDGTIHRNAIVLAAPFGSTAGSTLNVTGTIDGNLIFNGSKQDDTLNVSGTIGHNLIAKMN